MTRGLGNWALLFGAGLFSACGGPEPQAATAESSVGEESPLESLPATFNDYRGTWHGMAQMGGDPNAVRALLLVVGEESALCQRPAVGCVPVQVTVERGRLVVRGQVPAEGGASDTIEGRFEADGESILQGTLQSSACNCSGDARLDRTQDESFEGEWEATISFDPVDTHETRQLPVEFRSPEPFVLHVRSHGAEACSDAEGGCVNVDWIPQGPQAAFHFERTYEGVRVRTEGHIGRMSNGRVEGEISRAGGDYRRSGRIYLRHGSSTSL